MQHSKPTRRHGLGAYLAFFFSISSIVLTLILLGVIEVTLNGIYDVM